MPSFLKKLDIGARLQRFLTSRNLQYLDVLLTVVTDPQSRAYRVVWECFADYFPTYRKAADEAVARLRGLHEIVKEYRGG